MTLGLRHMRTGLIAALTIVSTLIAIAIVLVATLIAISVVLITALTIVVVAGLIGTLGTVAI